MLCCWTSCVRSSPGRIAEGWYLDGQLDDGPDLLPRGTLPLSHRGSVRPDQRSGSGEGGTGNGTQRLSQTPTTMNLSAAATGATAGGDANTGATVATATGMGNPIQNAVTPTWKRMLVFSRIKDEEVCRLERTPEDEDAFNKHPFECPICLRFSDHTLRSHCCRQYVCHACAGRMRDTILETSCPHCRRSPLILVDPKPGDQVRCYRDSPGMNEKVRRFNQRNEKENQRPFGTARKLWTDGIAVKA